jgi:dipeptidyl aminopeptidase/acylaminoacyl peptidase
LTADLWLISTDGQEHRLLAEGVDIGGPGYPYWSPDSRYIAFVRSTETDDSDRTTVWMIDIVTGKETKVEHPDNGKKYAWPMGWANNGTGFYYRSQDDVYFFSKETNTSTYTIALPAFTLGCDLSPDSAQILCRVLTDREKGTYELVTLSLQGQEAGDAVRQFQGEHFIAIWGPNDQSITINENLSVVENATLKIVESDTKNARGVRLQTSGSYVPRRWSPDAVWLAAQRLSEPGGDLYLFSNVGQSVNHIPTQGATDVLGWLITDLASS